jgi:hypothetical protein
MEHLVEKPGVFILREPKAPDTPESLQNHSPTLYYYFIKKIKPCKN